MGVEKGFLYYNIVFGYCILEYDVWEEVFSVSFVYF